MVLVLTRIALITLLSHALQRVTGKEMHPNASLIQLIVLDIPLILLPLMQHLAQIMAVTTTVPTKNACLEKLALTIRVQLTALLHAFGLQHASQKYAQTILINLHVKLILVANMDQVVSSRIALINQPQLAMEQS